MAYNRHKRNAGNAPPLYTEQPTTDLDNDQAPPPYSEFLNSTLPSESQSPPNPPPFDTTSIPESTILTPTSIPLPQSSTRPYETSSNGTIKSFDTVLNNNPKELFNFFMSNLQSPRQYILVSGSHMETRRVDSNRSLDQRKITDFEFRIDLSGFVKDTWEEIVCVPERGMESKSFREMVNEYCLSDHSLKE